MKLSGVKSLLDLFVPPLCEGCSHLLDTSEKRLCRLCLIDLEPHHSEKKTTFPFDRLSSVWMYGGAVQKLITRYKEGAKELDAPLFANYVLLQLDRLKWPMPDMVVTVPQDPFKKVWTQFDPIGVIGKEISTTLSIPLFIHLKRQGGRASQASLDKEGRVTLEESVFYLSGQGLEGKRVLLLDDVLTTGTTLKAAAHALWQGGPHSLYGLTLAQVPEQ